MEGERKKRKILESEEGEDDEEKKIEKFFALIRSTREVRDRLRSTGFNESKDQKEEKTRVEKDIKGITVWNPTFQPEDFIQDEKSSKSTPGATTQPGPSKSTKGNEEDDQDRSDDGNHGLDLNLSL